ncbi:MAG: hypothetical protein PUC37_07540 [Spirochaetales bacterium]|nr:hypothetical protein [Spirochaetales bacterium]
MKIYKITKAAMIKFCELRICDISDWINEKLYLNSFKEVHNLPICYYTNNTNNPHDFPLAEGNVVSKKFYKIIASNNKNIKAFESKIYYNGKNKKQYLEKNKSLEIWDNYYTIIFPEYDLLNYEKSDFETDTSFVTGKEFVSHIEKLVIDKEKLQKNTSDHFFILQEKKLYLLCTETAKQAIEEAGLIGIAFEEVQVE